MTGVSTGAQSGASVRADLKRALEWHRGPFLPDATDAWAIPYRDRLRSRLARSLARTADALERTHLQDVVDCFLRAIDADPLAEELRAHTRRCLQRAGQSDETALREPRAARAAAEGSTHGRLLAYRRTGNR